MMASSTTTPVVYVVDDDTDVLGSLRFLLETDGFEVRTFRSGAALLNGMVTGEVDCFVIDYKMPNMSGIELAQRGHQASTRCSRLADTTTPKISPVHGGPSAEELIREDRDSRGW